jgi:hypothetical protein
MRDYIPDTTPRASEGRPAPTDFPVLGSRLQDVRVTIVLKTAHAHRPAIVERSRLRLCRRR